MEHAIFYTACGTAFPFLMTVLGSAVVFWLQRDIKARTERAFLGFAAGVMMAAAVWSLLLPAIESANEKNHAGWLPVACGFAAGGLFLFWTDRLIGRKFLRMGEGWRFCGMTRGTTLALAANSLRNIPQGMSTGLAFLAACSGGDRKVMAGAVVLSLGLGIQKFLEGSAVSMPIRRDGVPAKRAFCVSAGVGALEPAFAMAVAALGERAGALMPWLLSFAAGAMIYVIAEELIPKASGGENDRSGTFGVMAGFLIMMMLDVIQ